MLQGLGGLFSIVSLVCGIIILIDAFKSAIWKGIVAIVTCGLYLIYYAFAEFKHEKKWPIVIVWLVCGLIGGVLNQMAMAASIAR